MDKKEKALNIKSLLMPLTLASGMLLSGGSIAQDVDNDPSIYVGGMRYLFDRDKSQVNEEGIYYGAEVPIPLGDRVSVALERYDLDSDFKNQQSEAELTLHRLGFNYHLNNMAGWQPYLSLGFGDYELEPDGAFPLREVDETSYDLGFGLKRDFGQYFLVRGDVKMLHGRSTSDKEYMFGLSVGLTFGGARQTTAVPTPAPEPEPIVEAPRDSDNDGVIDPNDRCPNTPTRLAVDENGCPILETSQLSQELLVEFEFDQADIRPQFSSTIEEFAQFMRTYTNTEVTIEGHTDSTGPDAYNQGLSERRANAVRDALIAEGIDGSRITAVGYGESRPVADNATPAGRERNRRIVAEVEVEIEEEVLR